MIMAMTQILSLILSRIRQPRVISEVIGGIILGPSIMGRIPGFTNAIFPMLSLPLLNLTSTIGLVLFLFLIGLEIDFRVIKRNARSSMLISAFGLIIPLGLGAALGVPIYHQFVDPSINFGLFLLFTAVAIGITAFPVLCRILTELKLLDDTVGVVVLAAGVGNDVRLLLGIWLCPNLISFTYSIDYRMDPARFDCCPCKCEHQTGRALGVTHWRWVHSLPYVSCPNGLPLARKTYGQSRKWHAERSHDDRYSSPRVFLCVLHGYHWNTSHLRCVALFA